ncbi:MAG: hypothetical protein PHO32_05100, partial [Candidatus Cloacimonetes bacterium]|nr:hypothetical protein [Candidatus Cloacimonadota bacterium]
MRKYIFYAVLSAVLCSCSVVPVSVELPWNRSLSEENIPAGAIIAIEVQAQSTPLLGSESLVEREIANKAASLLTRRGYLIADQNYQYKLNIYYKTQLQPRTSNSYSSYEGNSASSATYSSVGRYSWGYGVNLAQSIAASHAR